MAAVPRVAGHGDQATPILPYTRLVHFPWQHCPNTITCPTVTR